jgi:hypothetical protein
MSGLITAKLETNWTFMGGTLRERRPARLKISDVR